MCGPAGAHSVSSALVFHVVLSHLLTSTKPRSGLRERCEVAMSMVSHLPRWLAFLFVFGDLCPRSKQRLLVVNRHSLLCSHHRARKNPASILETEITVPVSGAQLFIKICKATRISRTETKSLSRVSPSTLKLTNPWAYVVMLELDTTVPWCSKDLTFDNGQTERSLFFHSRKQIPKRASDGVMVGGKEMMTSVLLFPAVYRAFILGATYPGRHRPRLRCFRECELSFRQAPI